MKLSRLGIVLLVVVVLGYAETALAETTAVTIPGEGWSISFDAPPLSGKEESRTGAGYAFRANSGRFNLSLFVERSKAEGTTHKDCYAFYWPLASRNPLIAKDTVVNSEGTRYFRVQYDIMAGTKDQRVRQKNVNYFIAFRGKWIDVHISVVQPTAEDEKVFTAFDNSLRYGD